MKYYEIKADLFGDKWAYGMSCTDSPIFDHKNAPTCPLCGAKVEGSPWSGPYDVKINKKKHGDFIYGVPSLFMASERFVNSFFAEDLKGIVSIQKINILCRKKPIEDTFFQLEIAFSGKKMEYAKAQNEKRKTDKSLPRCSLCKKGNGVLDNWQEIYFNDEYEYDIFKIYERPGRYFCTQRFVDFCEENKFQNIIESFYEIFTKIGESD